MAVFDKFFAKGGRHPLATRGDIQEAIDALPTAVRREALHKTAEWFASLDSPELSAAQKIDVLLSFDTATHKYQDLLWLHLRGSQSKDLAFVGTRQALIEYCAEFSRQVSRLIDEAAQNNGQKIARDDDLVVLAGRSLRALAGWKRIRHLDHEIIPAELWSRLFAVLRFAFQWTVETQEISIYENETTTLQREFLRAVILDTLPLANLNWRQIEIMNAVLDHFSEKFLLRAEPSQLTPYFLNLSQNSGPQHASRTGAPDAAIFVGPGAAFPDIVELARQVSENHRLPDWLTLPKNSKPAEIAKVLTLTVRHWSRTPPQRKSDRRHSMESLQVVHGFRQTRAALGLVESTTKTSTPTLGYYANNPIYTTQQLSKPRRTAPTTAEAWEIADESPTGVGIVPRIKSIVVTVGALFGCFRARGEQWQIAIARRTSHDRKGRFLVGIQFIPGTPYAANLGLRTNPTGTPFNDGTVSWYDTIAFLDQRKLLLEHHGFSPGTVALLQIGGQQKHCIKLDKLEETQADWENWTFLPATEQDWKSAPAASNNAKPT